MLADVREILVITMPHQRAAFESLLGDGSQWGLSIAYAVQPSPDGLAQALTIGEDFLRGEPACLILGDNIFYGAGLPAMLREARMQASAGGAVIFGYRVSDPSRYGVVGMDEQMNVVSIEEKPDYPKSHFAVTGLYFYDGRAAELARKVRPSKRGELEITSLNRFYMEEGNLTVKLLGRGFAWLDTGTPDSLLSAGTYVQTLEKRQGMKIACLEEIAVRRGFLTRDEMLHRCTHGKSQYYQDLADLQLHEPA